MTRLRLAGLVAAVIAFIPRGSGFVEATVTLHAALGLGDVKSILIIVSKVA